MSESMVELVKAAIAEKFDPAIDFKAPYAKIMLDLAARAAIAALRIPTIEMYEAFDGQRHCLTPFNAGWAAAIDAALQEKP